jgi:hypothetical protein
MVSTGTSEMIERPIVLEILHAVHNRSSTFGSWRSARTDPRLDPQRSVRLFSASPGLSHAISTPRLTLTVIIGE